jgi:hypothetical protein
MGSMFRLWGLQIRKYRVAIGVVAIVLVVVIALIIVGYRFDWTGFNGNNKSGKTLWDWMQLLIVPVALALIALLFNLSTTRNEQKIAAQRYVNDQQIALDKQKEDLLQTYLDRMSELLLKEQLGSSAVKPEVRNVARVRTLTVICQLDAYRNGYVFSFLHESGLIDEGKSIINMTEADLAEVDLRRVNLRKVNLRGADLSDADLRGAILDEADLSGTNLTGAKVTEEQLETAKSLKGVTMPDGAIHP